MQQPKSKGKKSDMRR